MKLAKFQETDTHRGISLQPQIHTNRKPALNLYKLEFHNMGSLKHYNEYDDFVGMVSKLPTYNYCLWIELKYHFEALQR